MTLTAAQRSKKNRENASKSTGPNSDAGKAKSRLNAVKHGLRAEIVALPNEDPEIVAAREQTWNDYYNPQSPAAQHLVNQCVRATLLSDRVDRYQSAALTKQVRNAELKWENTQGDRVEPLIKLLATDPARALPALKTSARGCRYLIGRWKALAEAYEERRFWGDEEFTEAVSLMGSLPKFEAMQRCPGAWALVLYHDLGGDEPSPKAVAELLKREHTPEVFRGHFNAGNLPGPKEAETLLRGLVSGEVERLEAEMSRLDTAPSDPSRDEAMDLAQILHDERSARLFLRYHSEARSSFHRAYSELVKTLARDAEEAVEAVAEMPSPNEATSPSESPESPCGETASDSPPAPESAPAVSPEQIETKAYVAARPFEVVAGVRTRLVATA